MTTPAKSPGKLIVVSGPSGSGKSTIVQRLRELEPEQLVVSVSATTRQARAGEVNGKDYHFLSPEDFKRRLEAGEFLEAAEVYPGTWYGTLKSEVAPSLAAGKWVLLEIDVRGAEAVRQHYQDAITIFIQPGCGESALAELRVRLEGRRTESVAAIELRLETARQELARAIEYRHQIVNDEVEAAAQRILDILRKPEGQSCSMP